MENKKLPQIINELFNFRQENEKWVKRIPLYEANAPYNIVISLVESKKKKGEWSLIVEVRNSPGILIESKETIVSDPSEYLNKTAKMLDGLWNETMDIEIKAAIEKAKLYVIPPNNFK